MASAVGEAASRRGAPRRTTTAVGRAAPWFILGVMLFSWAVRAVYIESSVMFVRGGVYRVVKEAMGGTMAKLSVSALLFDYVLTGPISAVSAGLYIAALAAECERVDAAVPDGWLSETDGVAHRAWRIRVVDEERLRPEKSEVQRLLSDNRLAFERLGWQPKVDLHQGLIETIDWIRAHLSRYRPDEYHI